jgi:hypothetical protein
MNRANASITSDFRDLIDRADYLKEQATISETDRKEVLEELDAFVNYLARIKQMLMTKQVSRD